MHVFSIIWRNLKPLTVSLFVQFAIPLIFLLLVYLIFVVFSAFKLFSIPWLDLLTARVYLFGYQWYPFTSLYFLSGPIFAVAALYYLAGKKKTLLMLFPLIFYIIYFLPLVLNTPFPLLYDKPNPGRPGEAIENKNLVENMVINGFAGSALVVQNNVLWSIDKGKVGKLSDSSYIYDFSKPLFSVDNKRYIISSDYSGSTILDLEKNTKIKTAFAIIAAAKTRPEAIGLKGNDRFVVNLSDLSQTAIPVSTSSAYIQTSNYLPTEKEIYFNHTVYDGSKQKAFNQIFNPATKQVTELGNQDAGTLLNLQSNKQILTKDAVLVYGSLEKDNIVQSGIWSVTADNNAPKLLYSPKDGSGIKSFAINQTGTMLAIIKIKSSTDYGTLAIFDLKNNTEEVIPASNIVIHSPTAPGSQYFAGIGWLSDGKLWVAANHWGYNNQNYQQQLSKWDIWLIDNKGENVTTVATDADNFLFLD